MTKNTLKKIYVCTFYYQGRYKTFGSKQSNFYNVKQDKGRKTFFSTKLSLKIVYVVNSIKITKLKVVSTLFNKSL